MHFLSSALRDRISYLRPPIGDISKEAYVFYESRSLNFGLVLSADNPKRVSLIFLRSFESLESSWNCLSCFLMAASSF